MLYQREKAELDWNIGLNNGMEYGTEYTQLQLIGAAYVQSRLSLD